MQNLPENVRLIIGSVLPLVIVILLSILVGPFGVSKVLDLQTQIDAESRNKIILTQKLGLLQSLSDTVSQDSGASLSAIPEKNPSLIVLAQIKTVSSQDGVALSGIKTGSPVNDPSGTSHVGISFQLTGDRTQIVTFLKDIANIAPLTLVDKIKMSGNGGSIVSDVTIQSYWSALPQTLPPLTTPIKDLTSNEKDILAKVTNLTQPSFLIVPPTEGAGKTNPFSQ